MSQADRTYAAQLDEIARELAGPDYGGAMSRLTGVHQRTWSRIKAAARDGEEYAPARGALGALHDALAEILKRLEPHRRA